jgi:plasmid stability protein
MATLHLRNVPDDVVRRLERLAARDGASVSAVAARLLAEGARHADDAVLLDALPDLYVDIATILDDLDAGRAAG